MAHEHEYQGKVRLAIPTKTPRGYVADLVNVCSYCVASGPVEIEGLSIPDDVINTLQAKYNLTPEDFRKNLSRRMKDIQEYRRELDEIMKARSGGF
jgi:hypothetical protein